MPCACGDFRSAADLQFTAKKAADELQAYRRGRLVATTRLIRDGLVRAGLNKGSLLDVGGGVGTLAFEMLDRGMATAVVADASSAYIAAAGEEAVRRGRTGSIQLVCGDFLRVSEQLPSAAVVALDRVVCCYPFYEPMLQEAVRHAGHALAFSYPRDRRYVRAITWFQNARRARRKSSFRTFVHPALRMRQIIERSGFELTSRRATTIWVIDIFVKRR